MLRMFGTGLKVSRSFDYSSVSELTYPSEESLVKATCRDPLITLLKAHLPTDPFPQHKRADLLLLVSSLNGLPSINGSVGSSSISSTMKSVGISTFPISKAGLQAFPVGNLIDLSAKTSEIPQACCFLNLPGKGRGGLYGGGPDGVSFFFATGLVGWLELALSVSSGSIELWFVLQSRFLQLDRVLVQGFVPARSSSVRLSAYSTKSSPSSSSMSTAIWGGLLLLGNCAHFLV
ncbi:unnamed protein product [Microthlaspi erraticum]|uniref:Uncharacterized protein n=1 Tax=Microthlaspi erraticum TaxID=1685480 RepID=A0A6D2K7G4_9BRAS|nr:unnamed protein product [Microthlaspi erraticum]